jgi:hypothetical protein
VLVICCQRFSTGFETHVSSTGAGEDNGIDHSKELTEISLRFYIFAIP